MAIVIIVVAIYAPELLGEAEPGLFGTTETVTTFSDAASTVGTAAVETTAPNLLAYAAGAALGNIAGQAVGNAIDTQHGFSFESLIAATLSAGIMQGIMISFSPGAVIPAARKPTPPAQPGQRP